MSDSNPWRRTFRPDAHSDKVRPESACVKLEIAVKNGYAAKQLGPGARSHIRARLWRRLNWVTTQGIHQRALTAVTDNLIHDAETLGIEFRDPYLYAAGDGEDPANPLPEGWVELLEEQAERLGWGLPGYESYRRR